MISVVSQFACHNESMLIGLFRQRQFADERKWLFVSADVRGAGTRDEPLRTSAWEATPVPDVRKLRLALLENVSSTSHILPLFLPPKMIFLILVLKDTVGKVPVELLPYFSRNYE